MKITLYLALKSNVLSTFFNSQPCTTVIWKMDTSFNNRRMGITSRAIMVLIIESPSECAMKCSENDACASFFHNCDFGLCSLHAVPYRSTLNTLEAKENRYYLPVSGTYFETCLLVSTANR